MLKRLFAPSPTKAAGQRLYAAAAVKARDPAFYLAGGVPDTHEGRFELYTLHVALVLRRLKGEGEGAAAVRQALFDAYVRSLDDSLRDMGVGDLSVGKKMRKLGEAFYGRLKGYDETLTADDAGALRAMIGRTVFRNAEIPGVELVTDYVQRASAALAAVPADAVLAGDLPWPELTP